MRTLPLVRLVSLLWLSACVGTVGDRPGSDRDEDDEEDEDEPAPCTDPTVVTRDVSVTGDADLADLPATCWELRGRLTVTGAAVTSLARLGDLRSVDDLEIESSGLVALDVESPIEVTGAVAIHGNPQLADLDQLVARGVAGAVRVEDNAVLASLGALTRITAVHGDLRIVDNPRLAAVELRSLVAIDGGLWITGNATLGTLDLGGLASVGSGAVGDLVIKDNPALTAIGSLAALHAIGGALVVDNNDALVSLAGMSSTIASINQHLVITDNAALRDLGRLSHTQWVEYNVLISGNPQLDACASREVDCCVDAADVSIGNNGSSTCTGPHSWCWTPEYGCPFGGGF